ncbi:hypothetical protein AB0F17_35110 [Nonomuraea sp. NPDC026600]|uniref:hypothetical protein n=1 Tax=Nonomuraea sp. NPDC026600 TaxID=3155363 RepID=UPI0033FF0732
MCADVGIVVGEEEACRSRDGLLQDVAPCRRGEHGQYVRDEVLGDVSAFTVEQAGVDGVQGERG